MIEVAETGSTNADLLQLAADGAEEGTWLRAGRQTAGRGRDGRVWQSPAGNLYASALVRLRSTDPAASSLAFVAAVALADAVFGVGPELNLQLKWPNDLLVDGAKLAGILIERTGDAVVLGFGANVAREPEGLDRPVTSLAAQGVDCPADMLFLDLAARLEAVLAAWRGEGLASVLAAWQAVAHPIGSGLRARLPDGRNVTGSFAGLDPDGALRLRLADGAACVIHAGDVFLV